MTCSHLDDERLSAHIDGSGDDAEASHLRSCRACESRLERLRSVSSRVRVPPAPPPDEVVAAAVAAARAAWAAERGEARPSVGVVTLESRRRVPRWVMPAVAAAAAVLVAIPVVASRDRGGDRAETAATGGRGTGGANREIAETDGGDLGDQSDPTALGRAIRGALPGSASVAALADTPAGATGDTSGESAPADGAPPAENRIPSGRAAEPKTTSTRPGAEATTSPPCAAEARTNYGQGLGPLVYSALVRWQGTPSVVLAYRLARAGDPGLDYRVLVMARQDCRLLVVQSL